MTIFEWQILLLTEFALSEGPSWPKSFASLKQFTQVRVGVNSKTKQIFGILLTTTIRSRSRNQCTNKSFTLAQNWRNKADQRLQQVSISVEKAVTNGENASTHLLTNDLCWLPFGRRGEILDGTNGGFNTDRARGSAQKCEESGHRVGVPQDGLRRI